MEFQDKSLSCVDCGAPFIWTAGEQLFFADKNFKNEPKRCKSCKAKRALDGLAILHFHFSQAVLHPPTGRLLRGRQMRPSSSLWALWIRRNTVGYHSRVRRWPAKMTTDNSRQLNRLGQHLAWLGASW